MLMNFDRKNRKGTHSTLHEITSKDINKADYNMQGKTTNAD